MGVVEFWEAHLQRQSALETLAEHSMGRLQRQLGTKPETAHCCYVWPSLYPWMSVGLEGLGNSLEGSPVRAAFVGRGLAVPGSDQISDLGKCHHGGSPKEGSLG